MALRIREAGSFRVLPETPGGNGGGGGGGVPDDNSVTTVKIVDGAVTAAKVAADVATQAELDSGLSGKANTSHVHSASDLTTGTLDAARMGSGTADSTRFLRGDRTWQTVSGGGGGATTAAELAFAPGGGMVSTDTQSAVLEAFDAATGGGGTPAGAITWINVKTDHGAAGNGSTDDLAALQAAADSMTNGLGLYFPPGRYPVSRSLVIGLNKAATSASSSHMDDPIVLFSPGAVLEPHSSFTTGVTTPDEKPLMLVMCSDARILYPRMEGTGTKGSAVGLRFGGGRNWRGADNVTTTLASSMTNVATSAVLTSTTGFPDVEGYYIEIDGERMFVRGGATSTTKTVTRGEEGGDAAETHAAGATVTLLGYQTVYRSTSYQPTITQCATGIEFGIKQNSTSSSGDCAVFGGYVTSSKIGIMYKGFVNRVFGTTVASCNIGHDINDVRNSSKAEIYGTTTNQCTNAAYWVRGGHGTLIDGMWSEQSDGVVTACTVRLGQTSGVDGATASTTAYDTRISSVVKIHPDTQVGQDELIHLVRCRGFEADVLTLSTNGELAPDTFVRVEATVPAHANNRIKKIVAWPGTGGKNRMSQGAQPPLPIPVTFMDPNIENQLVIESHYETDVNSTVGTVIGDGLAPVGQATYTVFKSTANAVTTYFVKNKWGHIETYSTDTGSVSGLKAVLDATKASDVHYHFTEGTFSFLDDVAGQFNATFNSLHRLKFTGEGEYRTTIRSLSNATTGSDNEPLSFTRCNNGYMAHMAFRAEGVPRNTSDGVDWDGCQDWIVENVRVPYARGNGFHVDGKDDSNFPARNFKFNYCTAEDCEFDGYETLAAEAVELNSCSARNNQGHGAQFAKSSPTAALSNKKSRGCTINGGVYELNGQDGINILSSDDCYLNGPLVRNNSQVTANKDGARIQTVDGVAANGNVMAVVAYDDQGVPTQRYGVNIGPTAASEANDNEVTASRLGTNKTGPFIDTGTRTRKNGHVQITAAAYAALTEDPTILYVVSG
jgi:hypothetical protein